MWSFIKHVSDHMAKPPFGEQKAPTLWPSSATAIVEDKVLGKCRRQAFYRYAKDLYHFNPEYDHLKELVNKIEAQQEEVSPYMRWIWAQGELYEDYVVKMAKESGVFVAGQTNVYVPKLNVSGKIDVIVINPETSKYHIVEVKSIYGFNSNSVLGTEAQQRKGNMGEPRSSHLMQLGIYQWWYANPDERFAEGLLVYGSRDTGRYGEFLVTVEPNEETGKTHICYRPNSPIKGEKVVTPITIESIVENYQYIQSSVDNQTIPDKDFDISYSQEKIEDLYQQGLLTKTETTQHEKRKAQIAEGKSRVVKAVEKGDWQCKYCQYKAICYEE